MRHPFRLLLAATALVASGCDSPTGSGGRNSLSFDYSGTRSGGYAASGPVRTASASYGLATYMTPPGGPVMLGITSLDREADHSAVFFDLILDRGTGTFTCGPGNCQFDGDIGFDGDARTPQYEDSYHAVAGTVQITTASDTRVAGTFAMEMADAYGNVQVRSGRFDLPISPSL